MNSLRICSSRIPKVDFTIEYSSFFKLSNQLINLGIFWEDSPWKRIDYLRWQWKKAYRCGMCYPYLMGPSPRRRCLCCGYKCFWHDYRKIAIDRIQPLYLNYTSELFKLLYRPCQRKYRITRHVEKFAKIWWGRLVIILDRILKQRLDFNAFHQHFNQNIWVREHVQNVSEFD